MRVAASIAAGTTAAGAFGAVDWSSTITLGSLIVGILVGFAGLVVLGYGARWKAAFESEKVVAESYRDGREAFQARADRLEIELRETRARNDELAELIGEQKKTVARLESLPNLERIVQVMADTAERADTRAAERLETALVRVGEMFHEVIDLHDGRAEERARRLCESVALVHDAVRAGRPAP